MTNLELIEQDGDDVVSFLRVGNPDKIHPEIRQYTAKEQVSSLKSSADVANLYDSVRVVGATAMSINHGIFSKRMFDVCIVDEASQITQVSVASCGHHTAVLAFLIDC